MKHFNKMRLMASVILLLCPFAANAEENDTIYYQNQSVFGIVYVKSSNAIISSNISVSSYGQLNLTANSTVTISPTLNVALGGILNIETGIPHRIQYSYDASGNRTQREAIVE